MGKSPIPLLREENSMQSRKHSYHIWLNDKEYIDLKNRSLISGLTVSDIIRLALDNQPVKSNPPKEFYVLLNKINNIGSNINQIAKHANQTGEVYYDDFKIYYNQIDRLIEEIRNKYL